MINEILRGAIVCSSLIIAIGAQNLFVLKQGLLRNHIFWVCTICFVFDFLLMTVGVLGVGEMINQSKLATQILALLGGLFLIYYGIRSWRSAYRADSYMQIDTENRPKTQLRWVVLSTLAVTLLNPHVYLDTVVIVGGVTAILSYEEKLLFLIGAVSVSAIWFYGIGYGARLLTPLFKQKRMWVILDFAVGCLMFYIAFSLLKEAFFY
ncbi:LysE/ArgO family amino acid transporter [Utexia brackfieldae]|uniref:LysE/ArgO family amino acid transporter n=1 Tax=Utexia brackfieldae TaxID=3074108 RepID=UPI00370DBF2E